MGTAEDVESLEAEIPRVKMNPKIPTSKKIQERVSSRHAVYKSWSAVLDVDFLRTTSK